MKSEDEEEKNEQREEEGRKERPVFLFHVCAGCLWIAAFVLQHQQRRKCQCRICCFLKGLWSALSKHCFRSCLIKKPKTTMSESWFQFTFIYMSLFLRDRFAFHDFDEKRICHVAISDKPSV